jgi:hypothetical protein
MGARVHMAERHMSHRKLSEKSLLLLQKPIFSWSRCADLVGELMQINVVSNNEVPVQVIDEKVVAQDILLGGVSRVDNAHGGATLGQQLIQLI